MSAVCKLSSKMPGDAEINGLDAVTDDIDGGTRVPTVRVRRIEPLGRIDDVPDTVKKAVATAEQKRTGRKAIPFDIVEVGEHAYGDTLDADE